MCGSGNMADHLFSDLLFVLCSSETLATGSEVRLADSALLKQRRLHSLSHSVRRIRDEDLVAKRAKVPDVDGANVGKEKKEETNLDVYAVYGNLASSITQKGQNVNNSKEIVSGGVNNVTTVSNKMPLAVISHSLAEVQDQEVVDLFDIDAVAAEDKGTRHTMEDAWVVLPDARLDYPGNLRCAHFAIYDGHGGRMAAEYAQKHLHANVLAAGLPRELMDVKAAKRAILEGFQRTDESLLQESLQGNWQDGATAVCVWVLQQMVFIANIGDAKAVLARGITSDGTQTSANNAGIKAIVLTREHKAIYPQERTRIQKAGGTITNGRLQGRIEVSRAFGDRHFKKVFGPSDAADFVQKQLKETSSAAIAARRLVRESVRERRCKDNCTAIVVVFKHSGPM
ncbi:hypothetical protein HPP92_009920 [Vanilla planifolia]|uniref:protein-serine/threonine phosphatase n=1 Tax=Vanilla planifolia TaxID=51239 RepID=A0A835QXZ3_VANPL|nr:hypothetical protein HPP92_009920 [Vanilla planifolia]